MRGGKTMELIVNRMDAQVTSFGGEPITVNVTVGAYNDEITFTTGAAGLPEFGSKLKVTIEWGEER